MEDFTQKLWLKQDQHVGDRQRLFTTIAKHIGPARVLYPGCFVDVAASFAFEDVTYLDSDDRAARFFSDTDGVAELIAAHTPDSDTHRFEFVHGNYETDADFAPESFDLLVSLYAGFISEHCAEYLRVGGKLLVNPSHGDAAMASIDPRFRLTAVIKSGRGTYGVIETELSSYLIRKKDQKITVASLHKSGRGVAYTKSPFAYLFERVE